MNEKSPAEKALKNLKDKRSLENDLKPENKKFLEARLLRANVELSELNIEAVKRNKRETRINIILGIINILIAAILGYMSYKAGLP